MMKSIFLMSARFMRICVSFLAFSFYTLSVIAQNPIAKDTLSASKNKDTAHRLLSEVVVYATRKSTITQDASKISFKPSEDLKVGSSVTDLFRNTPMLSYTEVGADGEPEVSIIGKNNTTIFINGKPTYLSMDAIMSMLAAKNAQEVERIEVITNPKPSPDIPQGGGIINIVLKDNVMAGWSGGLFLNGRQNSTTSGGLGASVIYRKKKFQATVNGMLATRGQNEIIDNNNIFHQTHTTQSSHSNVGNRVFITGGARTNFTFTPSQYSNLSFGIDGFGMKKTSLTLNSNDFFTQTGANNMPSESYKVRNERQNIFYVVGGHIDYEYKPDTLGSNFQARAMAYHFATDPVTTLITQRAHNGTQTEMPESVIQQASPYNSLNFRFLLSYNHVFDKQHSLESGLSYLHTLTQNNFDFSEKHDDFFIKNEQRSSLFDYGAFTYMGYVSYNANWTQRLQTIVNFTAQYYNQSGVSQNNGNVATYYRPYWFILPNVALSYNFSKNHLLSLSFLRKSEPPRFSEVNPFLIQQGNNTYTKGNENLQVPTYYEGSAIYTLKQRYIFSVRYTFRERAFTTVQFTDPDAPLNIISTPYNYGNQQGAFVSFSSTNTFFNSYWQMQNNLSGQYTHYKGDIPFFKINRGGWGGSLSTTNTISLMSPHKKNKWLATVDFHYNFPSFSIYGFHSKGPNLTLGIKKTYINWTFSLAVKDVLRTAKIYNTAVIRQLITQSVLYRDTRSLKLTVSYRINATKGQNKNRRIHRSYNNNDNTPNEDDEMGTSSEVGIGM